MDAVDKNHDLLTFRLADILRRLNERFLACYWCGDGAVYFLEPFYLGELNERDIRHFAALAGVVGKFLSLENGFLRDLLDSRICAVYDVMCITYEDITRYEKVMAKLKTAILQSRRESCVYDGEARLLEPYRLVHNTGAGIWRRWWEVM